MELKALLKVLKNHRLNLFLFAFFGAVVGTGIYFIPAKYISTGSFFVKRAAETSAYFFTYEGYYSQQTAISYTNTAVGLLESVDIQSKALTALNIPVNESSLRKYSRNIKAKKSSPQIVELTVKGNSAKEAKSLWEAMATELVSTNKQINVSGDSKLDIQKISAQPVVKLGYKSLWINIPAGILLALGLGIFVITLKEYD